MADTWKGAITRSPRELADHLDLWEVDADVVRKPMLARVLRTSAAVIREQQAEIEMLRDRVAQAELERRGHF